MPRDAVIEPLRVEFKKLFGWKPVGWSTDMLRENIQRRKAEYETNLATRKKQGEAAAAAAQKPLEMPAASTDGFANRPHIEAK